jgi:molybdate transport system substrate-binding protein
MRLRSFFAALALALLVQAAGAQQPLRVLSSNGMKAVVDDLRSQIERDLGRSLAVEFATTAALRERIAAGAAFDVVILTTEAIADLAKSGNVAASSVGALGRGGIGVGVRKGAAKPAIGTPEEMRRTLLAAKSLTWVGVGASRATIERMLAALGIVQDVQAKITLAAGVDAASESVANGHVELVITLISEILPVDGLDYVGPLPGDLQGYVSFSAGVAAGSAAAADGGRLVASLRAPATARVYAAKGMELAGAP